MNSSAVSLIALGLILLLANVRGAKRVTIDAGTGYMEDFILLLAGKEVMTIRGTEEIDEIDPRSSLKIPESMFVQAALSSGSALNLYFYGIKHGFRLDLRTRKTKRLRYGPHRRFLRNCGPDAAAWKGGTAYFFKGCSMAKRFDWNNWGKPENVKKFGLPCDLDAAWNIDGGKKMVLLRGDQVWIWDENDNVSEPINFHSMYNVTSWELIPMASEEI